MSQWMWKRWIWGAVTGTAILAGSGSMALAELPKKGETITLSFPGQPERKVTVLKATRKPDGSVETEVKDAKTGETFTILDEAPGSAPQSPPSGTKSAPPAPTTQPAGGARPTPMPPMPAGNREPFLSRLNPWADDKPSSPASGKSEGGERRFFGRLFSRDKSETPAMTAERLPSSPEEGNRRGLLNRIFGRKSDPAPAQAGGAMPAPGVTAPAMTAPAIRTPAAAPPAAVPAPVRSTTSEPPRVMPPRPRVAPERGGVPALPAPAPLPAIPAIPGSPPLSARPLRPGQAIEVVIPASYRSSGIARAQELEPLATVLANDPAPSARMIAARAVAQGRHASSEEAKALLFRTAQSDPCPAVRADCIGHLCKLGYYHPAFMGYLQTACEDPSEEIRDAAQSARAKMAPNMK